MDRILDGQAKVDLFRCYGELGNEDKEMFWEILACVGCEEEFKEYLEQHESKEEQHERLD